LHLRFESYLVRHTKYLLATKQIHPISK